MKSEEIVRLLRIERECVSRNENCDRQCNKCDLIQNTNKLLEMYDDAIYLFEVTYPALRKQYVNCVNENEVLEEENNKLRKEVKKRRKDKKRWKQIALRYKEAVDRLEQTCKVYEVGLINMRDRIRTSEDKEIEEEISNRNTVNATTEK